MISEEEVKSLMTAMKKRYGLDFTNYEPKSLNRGVTRLLTKHKMDGMMDFWTRVLQDDDFFMESIDDLLVNLTELFRNPDAWIMIRDQVLPEFKYKKNIDIWHAGCSTGEEICTMAIVLEECELLFKAKLLATDLSKTALNKAKKGIYTRATLKNYLKPFLKFFPNRSLEDYFEFSDNQAKINSRYQKNVTFQRHNLVEEKMNKKFDIIFCRNVMIYFDGELKNRVFKFLDSCLNEGGFLVLGYYDTMPNQSIDLFDIHDNTTRIYKKRVNQIKESHEKECVNS